MTAPALTLLLPPAFIEGIGGPELMMIMVLILVLFGGKKLPEFARGFGKAMSEIKKATSGVENEIRKATSSVEDEINSAMVPPSKPYAHPAPATPPPPPAIAAADEPTTEQDSPDSPPPPPADPKAGPSIHPIA